MATCKDCLHFKACANMLRAMGYTVDGDGLDADKRCEDFTPTAEYKKVVHGRWDDSGRYHFVGGGVAVCCTICGCALSPEEYERFHWNYCPVCGATMDGREKCD